VTIFVAGREHTLHPATHGRYRGHRFDGVLRPSAADVAAMLEHQGLDPARGALLAAVSALEGGFDGLQTYDRARFSWGFVQFAATGGLPALMLRMRMQAPAEYERYFQAVGLDAVPGQMVVANGSKRWRGWQAVTRLHDDPTLWKPFLVAAHDPVVQAVQVAAAYEHYLVPVRKCVVTVDGTTRELGALLASEPMGEAALFDHAVHRGLTYTARLFQHAASLTGGDPTALLQAARRLEPGDEGRWAALERALAAAG
jgi:peptidoglycan endopeptidase LytF